MTAVASVRREGPALVWAGALLRAAVPGLWTQAQAQLAGVERFELAAVTAIDSAGLALLAALVQRCDARPAMVDAPAGLIQLQGAYRMAPDLSPA